MTAITGQRGRRTLIGGIVCLLLTAPAALADVRTGSSVDPPGFPGGLRQVAPPRDVLATELTYDTQGLAYAKVTLAAQPDAAAMKAGITMILGTWEDEPQPGCVTAMDAHGSTAGGSMRLRSSAGGTALTGVPTVARAASTMTLRAEDPRLAGQGWDCGLVFTADLMHPDGDGDASETIRLVATATPPPAPPATKPPASKRAQPKRLRRAIKRCQRRHRGSRPSVKRARKRCIRRAKRKYRPRNPARRSTPTDLIQRATTGPPAA